MIALSDIVQAKRRVSPVINATPFALAPILSNMVGADVYLKKREFAINWSL